MSIKILIADDEISIRMVIESRLKSKGYEVIAVEDGKIALEEANVHHPDLFILDVGMPPPNGFQVCRTLKDDPNFKKTPVILLTARGSDSDKFWGQESGADAYLTKPYNPDELLSIIGSLINT